MATVKLSLAVIITFIFADKVFSLEATANASVAVDANKGNETIQNVLDSNGNLTADNITDNGDEETRALSGTSAKQTIPAKSCGRTLHDPLQRLQDADDQRIVGGDAPVEGAIPWIVELSVQRPDGNYRCGGTLLRVSNNVEQTDIVLTAAHCYGTKTSAAIPAQSTVMAGATSDNNANKNEKVLYMDKFIPHEQFDQPAGSYSNDIAIIKLKGSLKFSEFVQPACLPPQGEIMADGTNALFAGWGITQTSGRGEPSQTLYQLQMPIISHADCTTKYGYTGIKKNAVFCAGFPNGGKDICSGDSGGPVLTKKNSQYTVQGIVSNGFGVKCAQAGVPSTYTRVSNFIPWINAKIKQLSAFANR